MSSLSVLLAVVLLAQMITPNRVCVSPNWAMLAPGHWYDRACRGRGPWFEGARSGVVLGTLHPIVNLWASSRLVFRRTSDSGTMAGQ